MSLIPREVLGALDRLNHHARAGGCGRSAIYTYKTFATLAAALAGDVAVRLVDTVSTCRSCSGTGRYVHDWQYPDDWSRCRTCGASGRVRLRFTESRFDSVRWHHPWKGREMPGRDVLAAAWGIERWTHAEVDGRTIELAVLEDGSERPLIWERLPDAEQDPDGWRPRRPATALPAGYAALALNTVEAWIETASLAWPSYQQRRAFWWWKEAPIRAITCYRLQLDHVEQPCFRCGAADAQHAMGRWADLLEYSRPLCDACYAVKPKVWPTEPADAQLPPSVRTWLAHPRRVAKLAQRRGETA